MRYSFAHILLPLLVLLLAGCGGSMGDMLRGAEGLGICGIIHLALAVWAIINIVQARTSTERKLLWGLLVWFLPLIGVLLWLFAGPRRRRSRR